MSDYREPGMHPMEILAHCADAMAKAKGEPLPNLWPQVPVWKMNYDMAKAAEEKEMRRHNWLHDAFAEVYRLYPVQTFYKFIRSDATVIGVTNKKTARFTETETDDVFVLRRQALTGPFEPAIYGGISKEVQNMEFVIISDELEINSVDVRSLKTELDMTTAPNIVTTEGTKDFVRSTSISVRYALRRLHHLAPRVKELTTKFLCRCEKFIPADSNYCPFCGLAIFKP